MTRPHVTVVGDVGLDVVGKLAGPVVFGHDTRAQVTVTPGGAGGNTAAWLARHDLEVSLIARVGDDEAGRTARTELSAAGIDCRFAVDPTLKTCCVVVLVAPDGDRTMLADRGANAAFSVDDVNLPQVTGRGHLPLSGYVLLDDGSRPAGLAALDLARRAGWTTSVDPQAAVHIAAAGAANFLSWVSGADLLLPNDAELAALGSLDPVLDAVGTVVVTHGRHGASWYSTTDRINVPAPESHETDSTGAGDAFNAGLLYAWLTGSDPVAALQAGVAAGTAATARIGARPHG
jgi:sugar/nucleoside kinase (ribokinase family)